MKSNINNWISCSEDGGSLVTQTEGGLKCKVEKTIVVGVCEQVKPYRLVMHGRGPALYASDFYYYFETAMDTNWPVADPCGRISTNHLEDVNDPSGWIYIRSENTSNVSVHHVFNVMDPSSEYFVIEVHQQIQQDSTQNLIILKFHEIELRTNDYDGGKTFHHTNQ